MGTRYEFTAYTKNQVEGLPNHELLRRLKEHRDAISKGTEDGKSLKNLRANLQLLVDEETTRINLGILVVAPPPPPAPVYSAVTETKALQSRLFELKMTRGRYGINTAPEIHIEIDAIEKALGLPSSRGW